MLESVPMPIAKPGRETKLTALVLASSHHSHAGWVSRSLLVVAAWYCLCESSGAREGPRDSIPSFPTHAQFVQAGLAQIAGATFSGFPFTRGRPLWIAAEDTAKPNPWFHAAVARQLYERGLLVREPGMKDSVAESGSWLVRYRFDAYTLTLAGPTRRAFLGKIWLHRVFHVNATVVVKDTESGEEMWTSSADSTFSDWIPKRALPHLADPAVPFLSPVPPVTRLERWARPAGTAAVVGLVGVVFLFIR